MTNNNLLDGPLLPKVLLQYKLNFEMLKYPMKNK